MTETSDGPAPSVAAAAGSAAPLSVNDDRKQIVRNAIASYLSFFLNIGLGLCLTPVLLHALGVAGLGLLSFAAGLSGYLGLFEAGVSTAALQRVARYTATGDAATLADVLATCRRFFTWASVASTLVALLALPLTPHFTHLPPGQLTTGRIVLFLGATSGITGFFSATATAVLYGAGRGDRLVWVSFLFTTVSRVAQIAAALAGAGLIGVALASFTASAVSAFAVVIVARRTFPAIAALEGRATWPLMKDLLGSGRRNMIVSLAGTVAYGLDAAVIGIVRPVGEVAPYSVASQVVNTTRSVATMGTDQLSPAAAHNHALANLPETYRIFRVSLVGAIGIFIPLAACLIAFGQPLVHLWLGAKEPRQTYAVVVALTLVYLLQLPGNQSFRLLTSIDKNRTLGRIGVPSALVNLGLTIVATARYGPVGPAIGSLAVVATVDVFVLPLLVAHTLRQPFRPLLSGVVVPLIPLLAVTAAATACLDWLLPATAVGALVGSFATCGITGGVALLSLRRTPYGAETAARLRTKLGRFSAT